jgi:hypothetical protein
MPGNLVAGSVSRGVGHSIAQANDEAATTLLGFVYLSSGTQIMSNRMIIAAFTLLVSAGLASAQTDCPSDVEQGVWAPDRSFALYPNASFACYRMYYCGPGQQLTFSSNCRLVVTPAQPKQVTGVCSATGGDPSVCDSCSTDIPSDPCQYHLEYIIQPSGCGDGICTPGSDCDACCQFHCPNNLSECRRNCSPYR